MQIQRFFPAAAAAVLLLAGPAIAGPNKGKLSSPAPSMQIAITSPSSGATVHGTVSVDVAVPGGVALKSVTLWLDGYFVDSKAFAPWTLVAATAHLQPGLHTLQATATSTSGVSAQSPVVTVNVVPALATDDTVAPVPCVIVTPTNYQTVSGVVPVAVACADNVRVTAVMVYIDGNAPVAVDPANPVLQWNTAGLTGTYHYVQAIAYDAAGNYTVSPLISVKLAR